MTSIPAPKVDLYNGVIESATRTLIILEEMRPLALDLEDLRLAELFVVFGDDIGAPFTLHNLLPGRMRAYGFRRPRIMEGLEMLKSLGLVTVESDEDLPLFRSTGTPEVLHHLGACKYLYRMRQNAAWMASRAREIGLDRSLEEMQDKLSELLLQPMGMPEAMSERFMQLRTTYELDIERMEGLNEAAVVLGIASPKDMVQMFDNAAEASMREIASVRSRLSGLASLMTDLALVGPQTP